MIVQAGNSPTRLLAQGCLALHQRPAQPTSPVQKRSCATVVALALSEEFNLSSAAMLRDLRNVVQAYDHNLLIVKAIIQGSRNT